MKFYMLEESNNQEYTLDELYKLDRFQMSIRHPCDEEAVDWKNWINDPISIKGYYDQSLPKFFEDGKDVLALYKLDILPEENLQNLSIYNHLNVDIYNSMLKDMKYVLGTTTIDETTYPLYYKDLKVARDAIMFGEKEPIVVELLNKAFGKKSIMRALLYRRSNRLNLSIQEASNPISKPASNNFLSMLTQSELDNVKQVMKQYTVDVLPWRLGVGDYAKLHKSQKDQFLDPSEFGYQKLTNYRLYMNPRKELKVLKDHRCTRKHIIEVLFQSDEYTKEIGIIVDPKHRGDSLECLDGRILPELRWCKYKISIDSTERKVTYNKIVYNFRVDKTWRIPVITIITSYKVPKTEFIHGQAKSLYKQWNYWKDALFIEDDDSFASEQTNIFGYMRMFHNMTGVLLENYTRRRYGVKFRLRDNPSEIITLNENQLMNMTADELIAYEGVDKTTDEWLDNRLDILHPAEFVEKYYDADHDNVNSMMDSIDDEVCNAITDNDYRNWYYHDRYDRDDEPFTEERLDRLRKYSHKNADIFNKLYRDIAKTYPNQIIPYTLLDEWESQRIPAYDAIVYGHPQDEIRKKLNVAYGKEAVDKVWYKYYPEDKNSTK